MKEKRRTRMAIRTMTRLAKGKESLKYPAMPSNLWARFSSWLHGQVMVNVGGISRSEISILEAAGSVRGKGCCISVSH